MKISVLYIRYCPSQNRFFTIIYMLNQFFSLSLHKIGCTSANYSNKFDILHSVCTIFAYILLLHIISVHISIS